MGRETFEEIWAGYPADLREMMIACYLGEGDCSPKAVIDRLKEELTLANRDDAAEILERVAWIDRFFGDCLMDFDTHCGLWEENGPAASDLLEKAEQLLTSVCPAETGELRAHKRGEPGIDAIALSQQINAYRCVSAAIFGNDEEFQERLARALADAEANVDYLLASPKAEELVKMEDTMDLGFHVAGHRFWTEPLAMLQDVAWSISKARFIRKAYEQFVKHLEKSGPDCRAIRGRLLVDAERILGKLADYSIDEVCLDYPLTFSATKDIRALAAEHPNLPIVIFAAPEGAPKAYADTVSVGVVELLNHDHPCITSAMPVTNRDQFASMLEERIKWIDDSNDSGKSMTDDQTAAAVRSELEKYESAWTQVIAITATWKEY